MPDDEGTQLLTLGARLAGHAELIDVRTFNIEAGCEVVPPPGARLGFDFEFDALSSELDADSLTVAWRCAVDLFLVDEDDAKGSEVGHIAVVLGALFEVRTPDGADFTQPEVDAYCATTVRMTVYPYARAAVSDLTGRLGLPHLTLPMLKIALPAPKKKAISKKR